MVIWNGYEWIPAKVECKRCKPGTCLDMHDGKWRSCLKCARGHLRCVRKDDTIAAASKGLDSRRDVPAKANQSGRDDDIRGGPAHKAQGRENSLTENLETKVAENTLKLRKMEERLEEIEKLEMMRASLAKQQLDLTFEMFTTTTVEKPKGSTRGLCLLMMTLMSWILWKGHHASAGPWVCLLGMSLRTLIYLL